MDWLRLPETERYVAALGRKSKVGKSHFARTVRGGAAGSAGTWLHPKLAISFAQWLDVDFAVWCDEQIERILTQGQAAGAVAVEYLPEYHELHDRVHEWAAESTNERFVQTSAKFRGIKGAAAQNCPDTCAKRRSIRLDPCRRCLSYGLLVSLGQQRGEHLLHVGHRQLHARQLLVQRGQCHAIGRRGRQWLMADKAGLRADG